MARTVAGLPAGTRLTDHISLGVLTARMPLEYANRPRGMRAKAEPAEAEGPRGRP